MQVVGGYPVLTKGLAWPGLPLFPMGNALSLQIGPMAGNLFHRAYTAPHTYCESSSSNHILVVMSISLLIISAGDSGVRG